MDRFNNCYSFGPVPSRRLGKSLGINNIPQKICSYSCIYCQIGRTRQLECQPGIFYEPEHIYNSVASRILSAREKLQQIDYLAFVPDGEPTLDKNLGKTMDLLKPFKIPIAVITNGSMLIYEEVRETLGKADWVSIKIDSVVESTWKKINAPQRNLVLDQILEKILLFSKNFRGNLMTETMLLNGMNDDDVHLDRAVQFIKELHPRKAYISIPIRPPASKTALCPDGEAISRAWRFFQKTLAEVEILNYYEGNSFVFTGDARKDILAITSVHPMRKEAIEDLLKKAHEPVRLLSEMIQSQDLIEVSYQNHLFYRRNFHFHEGLK